MSRPKLNAMPHVEAQREAARRAREADRAPLQDIPACDACGLVGEGLFGFDDFSDGRAGARYACSDADCQAKVAAQGSSPAEPSEGSSPASLFDHLDTRAAGKRKTRRAA